MPELKAEIVQHPNTNAPRASADTMGSNEWFLITAAISAMTAAVGWFGPKIWGYFSSKEEAESTLMATLINDLREDRAKTLNANQQGFEVLAHKLDILTQTVQRTQKEIDSDIQTALKNQAGTYTSLAKELGAIAKTNDALHRRLDEFAGKVDKLVATFDRMQQIAEARKNATK